MRVGRGQQTGWVAIFVLASFCMRPAASFAIDLDNLEDGYPLPLEDARILAPGEQTITIAVGIPDLFADFHEEYLDIEIHQGLSERWQVSWTGSLDNFKGNSDGFTAAELTYLLRAEQPGRAAYAINTLAELGATNDKLRLTFTGIATRRVSPSTSIHLNAYQRDRKSVV